MTSKEPEFYQEIRETGYHVYNHDNQEDGDFYEEDFSDFPTLSLKDLQIGDIITCRIYFGVGSGAEMEVDSGFVDLRVVLRDVDRVVATIISELPDEYMLSHGDSLELFPEEILYRNEIQ